MFLKKKTHKKRTDRNNEEIGVDGNTNRIDVIALVFFFSSLFLRHLNKNNSILQLSNRTRQREKKKNFTGEILKKEREREKDGSRLYV
jgi:hypothetical protein